MVKNVCLGLLLYGLIASALSADHPQPEHDLVIKHGRVIDPESGFDKVANIGITGTSITAISTDALNGKQTIDARGLVVAPGFIDVHSHTPTLLGQAMNISDGITTALDLEAGAFPVGKYGEHFAGGAKLNYGSSVGHFAVRAKVMDGVDQPYIFSGKQIFPPSPRAWIARASQAEIQQMRVLLEQGLSNGGLGIGVLLDYMTAAVSDAELEMIFRVAAKHQVPVYVHVRRGIQGDPAGLHEVVDLAKSTGAPLFICHITHNAMGKVDEWLAVIDKANQDGADITTETLSYLAGGTSISADVFQRRDWRTIFGIDYSDVQWVATGEWLTEERWQYFSKHHPTGMVNHHYVKADWLRTALAWPGIMVSTDALPAIDRDVASNPNIAGTFARFLGRYVRDEQLMSLSEGLARTSLHQAKWLQRAADRFKRKGRLQVGMDADIVVFNAATIEARADYGDPYQPSKGIEYVIVGGRTVLEKGKRIEGRYPGQHLLAE